jgi:hypothetical protein
MSLEYWNRLFKTESGTYSCPWCQRDLKPKMSNSAKNPGKTFVSCSKDFGGCGLFSFLDQVPNEQFNPNKQQQGGFKRAREAMPAASAGTNVMGSVANAPTALEQRFAELALKVDALSTKIDAQTDLLRQLSEN